MDGTVSPLRLADTAIITVQSTSLMQATGVQGVLSSSSQGHALYEPSQQGRGNRRCCRSEAQRNISLA